jgi:hypothetical protein
MEENMPGTKSQTGTISELRQHLYKDGVRETSNIGSFSKMLAEYLKTPEGKADAQIHAKWKSLKGIMGKPQGQLLQIGQGYCQAYDAGRIYYLEGVEAHWVYGGIGDRYTELGGPSSWLGWPTSDEQDFTEGGRASTFQNGAIYWWPDTGAIDLGPVSVRYAGLACFSTTQGPGSDEPYAVVGALAPPKAGVVHMVNTPIYKSVDGGDSREEDIEVYGGLPYGITLTCTLFEHDSANPDQYRAAVKSGVDQAAKGIATVVGYIPIVGPVLGPMAGPVLEAVSPTVVDAINKWLGTDDDLLGTATLYISAKNMVTAVRVDPANFRGILWHRDSPLISHDGGDYKLYFRVTGG